MLIVAIFFSLHQIVTIIAGVSNNIAASEASIPPLKTILECNKI